MLPDINDLMWNDLNKQLSATRQQIANNQIRTNISQVTGGLIPIAFASLPVVNNTGGDLYFVTNGRKVGEGVGAGTGVIVYWNSTTSHWLRITDDSIVAS